jgi:2-dehydro-3-deoxygalactonokinase
MSKIDCIVVDWGTSNRRAWALQQGGGVLGQRHDDQGLLAITDRQFAASLQQFCGDWFTPEQPQPVIMCGMVGSKLGWQEVPYQLAPLALSDLARHLVPIADKQAGALWAGHSWIVPGVAVDRNATDGLSQPDVMRGEECQILGALRHSRQDDGVFVLPGTHAKWVRVEAGQIVDFRTYMTGELFGMLRKSGTLSQLMTGDSADDAAFERGIRMAQRDDVASLLHALFGVRTLGLFDRLPGSGLASYMSGLLIGTEIRDAQSWLHRHGNVPPMTVIGSPTLLRAYRQAAGILGIELTCRDSADLLPAALLSLAKSAGLLANR